MSITHVKNKDINLEFSKGFAQAELLAGVYPGVYMYRCVLKAGGSITPEIYGEALQLLCLTDGEGYITTPKQAFQINELSFFLANLNEEFTVHAATDLTFTKCIVDLTAKDMEMYGKKHLVLPFFCKLSQDREYWQSCKTPGTRSWSIISAKQQNRLLVGVCMGHDGGTIEKGHPALAQWNIILKDSDLVLTVDNEEIEQQDGDASYIPAGLDHSLVSKPGQSVNYIWIEHYIQEVDYIVTNPHN